MESEIDFYEILHTESGDISAAAQHNREGDGHGHGPRPSSDSFPTWNSSPRAAGVSARTRHSSLISSPMPLASARANAKRAVATSSTAIPTDLNSVMSPSRSRPAWRPA